MTHMVPWLRSESHLVNGDIVKGPVQSVSNTEKMTDVWGAGKGELLLH